MSSIKKMTLSGIRSFKPDSEQTIEFYSPLTMIVGQNGCGKTTIIESLKYACSGSMPPSSRSGQSFLNDPSMTDATEVKAQIKLRFENRSKQLCLAIRSLQITKKRTKMEFKALESVLKTTNSQDEIVSTSMKCTDMDRLVPENLGVLPAILENVIFCHQEDSNWPMLEGKVLKERFDDVFESTRYTNALEELRKAKKKFQGDAKNLEVDVKECGAHLLAAKSISTEIEDCNTAEAACKVELESLRAKIQAADAKLKECGDIIATANRNKGELASLRQQLSELTQRITDREGSLEAVLNGSDAELRSMLQNFEAEMQVRKSKADGLKRNLADLEKQLAELRTVNEHLSLKKGQAELLTQQATELKQQMMNICKGWQRQYKLTVRVTEWTPTMADEFLEQLQREEVRLLKELDADVAACQRVHDEELAACNAVSTSIQKLDMELQLKSDDAAALSDEIRAKRAELSKLSSAKAGIHASQLEFEQAKQTHDDFMLTFGDRANEFKRQIKDATDDIRKLQEQIASDSQLLQDLSLHRSEIASLDAATKLLETENVQLMSDVESAIKENREVLADGIVPTTHEALDRIVNTLNEGSTQRSREQFALNETLSLRKSELAGSDALLSEEKSRVATLQSKITPLIAAESGLVALVSRLNALKSTRVLQDSDLEVLAPASGYQTVLDAAKRTEDEARELHFIARSGKAFLNRLKKRRKANKGNCPCCSQTMAPELEDIYEQNVRELVTFGAEGQQIPTEEFKQVFEDAAALHQEIQEMHHKLAPLESLQEDLAIAEQRVVEMTTEGQALKEAVSRMSSDTQSLERRCVNDAKAVRTLSALLLRWQGFVQKSTDLAEKKRRQSQGQLTAELGGRTIQDLEQDHRRNQERKDELQMRKEKLQSDESSLTKHQFAIKTLLTDKEKLLADAMLGGNKYSECDTTLQNLQRRVDDIGVRQTDLQHDRENLLREQSEKRQSFQKVKLALASKKENAALKRSAIQKDRSSLSSIQQQHGDVLNKLVDLNLVNVDRDMSAGTDRIRAAATESSEKTAELNKLTAELASEEHTKRNVESNLSLRGLRQDLAQVKDQYRALQQRLGVTDEGELLTKAQTDTQKYAREKQTLTSERDRLEGKVEVYAKQVMEFQLKLNSVVYRDIEERHRRKNIAYETTKLAVDDLESYHNALDGALQEFHSKKIVEINKIIRELWQMIYKGHDIDMIELVSGVDDTATAAAKNTRNYNYRVVMRKGGAPLDMRGRCSAGQKVLAAIVIRLALAETFCLNCGILALDEPTTNLDEENKRGLAQALARIIIGRSRQQNFQLICITHDEDFVHMISQELSSSPDFSLPEYYFRVFRQEEGSSGKFFSKIERIPWEDM